MDKSRKGSAKELLIIFDMDGVLIDVSGSYREVVRRTVDVYLRNVLGARELREGYLPLTDVDRIKKSGGLNNDWDLSYAIINCILKRFFDPNNASNIRLFTDLASLSDERRIMEDIAAILHLLDSQELEEGLGTLSLFRLFHDTIAGTPSPFLLNRGDVKSGNVVKRIFQELYLGADLFLNIYGEGPVFHTGAGLIDQEKMIPTRQDLDTLTHSHLLAIATGRPGVEAHHALKHFGISDLFVAVVTEDDVVAEEAKLKVSLRKPHPFSILRCMEKSGSEGGTQVYYVGDMPDDILAACSAGAIPIGFVKVGENVDVAAHEKLLNEKGAFRVCSHFNELVGLFS